jgi:hypothetical protein
LLVLDAMPETAEVEDPGTVLGNPESKDFGKRNPRRRAVLQERE